MAILWLQVLPFIPQLKKELQLIYHFLIVTLIHLPTIAGLVPLASRPLLWLGLGL